MLIGDRLVIPNLSAGHGDFSFTVVIRLQPKGAKLCNTFRDRCHTRYTLRYGICWRSVWVSRRERSAYLPDGRSAGFCLLLQRIGLDRTAACWGCPWWSGLGGTRKAIHSWWISPGRERSSWGCRFRFLEMSDLFEETGSGPRWFASPELGLSSLPAVLNQLLWCLAWIDSLTSGWWIAVDRKLHSVPPVVIALEVPMLFLRCYRPWISSVMINAGSFSYI